MTPQHHLPADIERTSLSIITAELEALGLTPPPETAAVVKRVIHTTADFDYARNLRFTPGAVAAGVAALQAAAPIVTDTNMALSGITKPGLARLGGTALCYMADPEVAALAKANGTTRGNCKSNKYSDQAVTHGNSDSKNKIWSEIYYHQLQHKRCSAHNGDISRNDPSDYLYFGHFTPTDQKAKWQGKYKGYKENFRSYGHSLCKLA